MDTSDLDPKRGHERLRHRRDLAISRALALRRLHRRVRAAMGLSAVLAVGLAAVPFVAGGQMPLDGAKVFDALIARSASFKDLVVQGTIRIVDARGREIAFLGREGEDAGGASTLTLTSSAQGSGTGGDARVPTLRLAASAAGSAVALDEPRSDAGVAVVASRGGGPRVEIRQGRQRRVLSAAMGAPGRAPRLLPSVAAPAPFVAPVVSPAEGPARVWDLGHGFLVSELRAEPASEGVAVSGRVINATSLKQTDVHFRLSAAGRDVPLRIGIISPGNSTGFRALLPGATLAETEALHFDFQRSTVRYAAHTLRTHRALRQP
ncbi:MAG: hypothetical protein ACE5IL_02135 [Myxococcota bacterium]